MKIFVQVKPNSRQQKIIQHDEAHYVMWVRSQPIEGKANIEVIELLSRHFDVPKSCVVLEKGSTGPYKTFEIIT